MCIWISYPAALWCGKASVERRIHSLQEDDPDFCSIPQFSSSFCPRTLFTCQRAFLCALLGLRLGRMDFERRGKSLLARFVITKSHVTIGGLCIGAPQPANPIGVCSRRSHDLRASNGARTGLSISRNLARLRDGDAGRLDSVMNHAHLRILANPAIGHLCLRGGSQNA